MPGKISSIKILLLFLILLLQKYPAQDYSFFPEPIKKTFEYYDKGELAKAMDFNVKALEKYKKLNDKDGIITAYTNIASLLFSVDKLKESMHYLDKAGEEMKGSKNPLFQTRFYGEYARIYTRLGLQKQSNESFEKAIDYAKKIPNEKQKTFSLFSIYTWKRLNFLNQQDSLRNIEKKLIRIMPSAITYSKIADGFIDKRIQLDSAAYYLNKADAAPDYNSMAVSGITLFSYGKLYQVKGDYHQALEYYLKSVSALQKTEFRTYTRTAFDSISNTYGYLNNAEKSNEYLKKYKAINDTIKNEEKAAVNIVVNKLLQQEMQEKQKQKKNLYFIFSGFVVLVLIIIYTILRFYRTKQLRKENLLEQQTMENMQLKRQLDGSVDQIIELAKTNSPFFLTRFRETYSDFIDQLLSHQSNLTDYDLKLAAFIKLGLNTKEIAQYENVSLRTAESRKYRLKKKLKLDSETSLNKWILEL
ncbi:tetratricopeptide repeat protein [Elizabethkingia sp. HX WHF]|uniref:helix-turn-helix transcriptional regulator n=1 Tax=Elizabethkingia TaxID=308865 RepID=UPI00099AF887|nr:MULTISPECIES: tetratricopeptide repeat protein [Elizabethkingia]ATL43359.1 tetratricopeptide repeat-containing protein [Elizabethkingia miricola]MCL1638565.1 tetratricopeptide repeat protein [Elizabethkingia bruuniana]MDX8564404.1 tetratricopeptide repeat protein [Elizabethkingia sp. HX WHF]OPC26202.1 hypothetical protein BAY00_02520 [Elizabethkingia bruuniana]